MITQRESDSIKAAKQGGHRLQNGDYRDGLTGWSTEDAGDSLGVFRQGDQMMITSYGYKQEASQGRLYQCFTIPDAAAELKFFVHGGQDPQALYVALWAGERLIHRVTGRNDNEPFEVRWDLSGLKGQAVTLEIRDAKAGAWGLKDGKAKVLNCLTPHGKWKIHSTYGDTLRMKTHSRGCEPCWLSEQDASELGIRDNDWVEVYNDHGVYCTRACVSARIPPGVCIVYHVPERTVAIPKSQVRGNRRAGGHNSFTRVHLKPNLLCGGYGQFSYHFNYWGPIASNRETHVTVKKMDKVVF